MPVSHFIQSLKDNSLKKWKENLKKSLKSECTALMN